MQKTRQRISRIRRLREIDDVKLDQLAGELNAIDQQIHQWSEQLSGVDREIDDSLRIAGEAVVTRSQSGVWTDHLHQISVHLSESIERGSVEREKVHGAMIDQRAKVRGWELLLERLEEEVELADQQIQILEADDRFLSNQPVK